jgi:WD40 repeat protein
MRQDFHPVVIGVGTYDDKWDKLPDATVAAEKVAKLFGAEHNNLGEERAVNIRAAITEEFSNLSENSCALLYWVGHGYKTGTQHYLICKNSPVLTGELDADNAVSPAFIGQKLAASKASHRLVVLDTCYSGQAAFELHQSFAQSSNAWDGALGYRKDICVFYSTHAILRTYAATYSNAFVQAFSTRDEHKKWDASEQFIEPSTVRDAIDALLLAEDKCVHNFLAQGKCPNPFFKPQLGTVSIEMQRLESIAEGQHFDLAARGIETGETGLYFSGRKHVLSNLYQWVGDKKGGTTIVTGKPGSGKSAVIGRLVTLSVPELQDAAIKHHLIAADELLPPANSIDIAIHAKGKTVLDCAEALRRGTQQASEKTGGIQTAADIADIVRTLQHNEIAHTIVIDALDEAEAGHAERIAEEIIRPLANMHHKLLIGTRRRLDGRVIADTEEKHHHLRDAFGTEAQIYDLTDEPDTTADIAEFVSKRLHAASNKGADHWINIASTKVADASEGNFLYARLVARMLEDTPDVPIDHASLPKGANAAFLRDVQTRFAGNEQRVQDMLRAVAFALGKGVSRAVWPLMASVLSNGQTYSEEDVIWMLQKVGSYLLETTVKTGGVHQAAFRLIHQALADQLRDDTATSTPHQQIVEALMRGVEGERWLQTDGYIRRHLISHAALADKESKEQELAESYVARLISQIGFLAVTEAEPLLLVVPFYAGNAMTQLYRIGQHALTDISAINRWSVLHLLALKQQLPQTDTLLPPPSAPWQGVWAKCTSITPHQVIGRHKKPVISIAYKKIDNTPIVASGGLDTIIQLWNMRTCVPFRKPLEGHKDCITSIVFGDIDEQPTIISGSKDGAIHLWRVSDGTRIGLIKLGNSVVTLAFENIKGNPVIISLDKSGTIKLWDAHTCNPIETSQIKHQSHIVAISFGSINGKPVIVSGEDNGLICVWDVHKAIMMEEPLMGCHLIEHHNKITAITLAKKENKIVVASSGVHHPIRVWNAMTGKIISLKLNYQSQVTSLAFESSVGSKPIIISGDLNKKIRRWDADNGNPVGNPMSGHMDYVTAVATGEIDEKPFIISGSFDTTIRLWDAHTRKRIEKPLEGHKDAVISIAFWEINGEPVIVSGSKDNNIRVWDVHSGEAIGEPLQGHTTNFTSVAFGAIDGKPVIVSGSKSNNIWLWDEHMEKTIGEPLQGHRDRVTSVALGEINGNPVIISGSADCTLRLWDARSRKALRKPLQGHNYAITSIALGEINDNPVLISRSYDSKVCVWDIRSMRQVNLPPQVQGYNTISLTVGAIDGNPVIISGSYDHTIRLWDARSGEMLLTIPMLEPVSAVAILKTGEIYVGLHSGGVVCIRVGHSQTTTMQEQVL